MACKHDVCLAARMQSYENRKKERKEKDEKNKKFSLLLMLVTAFVLLFGMQITANAKVKKGSCGIGVNWTLDTETGVMNITGNGAMNDWSYKGSPWNAYASKIKTVIIREGITSIGKYAFVEHRSITRVQMANSIKKIGDRAFSSCSQLTTVTWPDKLEEIGVNAFNSSAIQSVELKGNMRIIGNLRSYIEHTDNSFSV